jgi:hypothetical protein
MSVITDEILSTGQIDRLFESEVAGAAATAGVLVPRDPGLAEWEHNRIIITRALYRDMFHDNPKEFADMIAHVKNLIKPTRMDYGGVFFNCILFI